MNVILEVKTPRGLCRPDEGGFSPYKIPCLKCADKASVPAILCQKAAEKNNPKIEKYKKLILFP